MIQLATIGTSTITHQFAAALKGVEGIGLGGAYSRDAQRAAEAAASLGARRPWSDFEAMLASDEVDAVYVASPNAAHVGQCRAAILAGKHVIVEKPAVLTSGEWTDLVDLAEQQGVVLMEAMRSAYDPGMALVRELIAQLGTVRRVSFEYCQRSSRYDQVLAGQRVNIFDPALGGGALNDIGVYVASALVDLFGPPDRIRGEQVLVASGADGIGAAVAHYPGFVAQLAWSKITASDRPSVIEGELGTLTIDSVAQPGRLGLHLFGAAPAEHVAEKAGSNLRYEIERFVDLIAGDGSPAADQQRTLTTLTVMEAIRASVE
ncbi:MAG TPA: Gfo/Idh/MocA family oxidoreductase [Propionibacteriaceae bacterium]|nr:Gfo/Idh/MocA family oxidoreductase [Propionibacteriaceae bacterium]